MEDMLFVQRTFELGDAQVVARFYTPKSETGGEFRCRWSLSWPGREVLGSAPGEDSVQALTLAMRSVHEELIADEAYRSGKLTLWGQSDLDLPPTWGNGPLYHILD